MLQLKAIIMLPSITTRLVKMAEQYIHTIMCNITFKDNSTSTFINNTARNNGGAILSSQASEITFEGSSTIILDYNIADNGGAGYFNLYCNFIVKENAMITFDNNKALNGGAICINMMTEIPLHSFTIIWLLRVEEHYKQ